MRKKIAIDINDVLRDYTRQFCKMYKKVIDETFDISYDDINSFDFLEVFPFPDDNGINSKMLLDKFKYEDCAYEIYGRAESMDRTLAYQFNLWIQNTMNNFDEDKIPEIILFSPFEMGLTIPSTLSFLSRLGIRAREIVFPIDSTKMWDKCDIMITANPNLLEAKPEDKVSFKIEAPYNKKASGTFDFKSMLDIIQDDNKTIIKLIEDDSN